MVAFVGFLVILFLVFAGASIQRQGEVLRSQYLVEAERIGTLVATHINTAASVGDGYSANFTLPPDLQGAPYYFLSFPEEERIVVVWGTQNASFSAPVSTSQLLFNVTSTSVRVRNQQGIVYVE